MGENSNLVTTQGDTKVKPRSPMKFLTVVLVLTFGVLIFLAWFSYTPHFSSHVLSVRRVKTEDIRGRINYLSEVLTMSSRMAAATGDPRWEERYREFVPRIDAAIKEISLVSPGEHNDDEADDITGANIKRLEIENKAFDMIRSGRTADAMTLLAGDEYIKQTQIISDRSMYIGLKDDHFQLEELRAIIIHLDETLTMSARLAAATGDLHWEERYRECEPMLGAAIEEAIEAAPEAYSGEAAARTDEANIRLVDMENRAFDLVRQGRAGEANALLFSDEYEEQKRIYSDGMAKFGAILSNAAATGLAVENQRALLIVAAAILALLFLLVSWFVVYRSVRKWEVVLIENDKRLTTQAAELNSLNQSLEQRVKERTNELETIIESAPVGIILVDVETRKIVKINENAVEMTGCTKDELIGKHCHNLICLAEEDKCPILDLGQKVDCAERVLLNYEGNEVPVLKSVVRVKIEGRDYLLETFTDITDRKVAEEKTERAYLELDQLFNAQAEGMRVVDTEFNIIKVNDSLAKLAGMSKDELEGRKCFEILRCDRCHTDECTLAQILSGKEYVEVDVDKHTVDGRVIPCTVTATPYRGLHGELLGIVSSIIDITHRKKAEEDQKRLVCELTERVKEIECLYAITSILTSSEGPIDTIFNKVVDLIPSGWKYSEISCARVKCEGREFTTENFKETEWMQSSDLIISGEKNGTVEVYYLEEKPEKDEGPFLIEERNLLNAISKQLGDAFKRSLTEAQLRLMEQVVQEANDGIAVADTEGNIMHVNRAWARMHGYDLEETIGKHLSNYHTEEQVRNEVIPFNAKVLETGSLEGEIGHVRKDGTTFPTRMTVSVLRDEYGETSGLIGIANDITDRKRSEAALRESEESYRVLAENVSDVLWTTDLNLNLTFISPSITRLTGFTVDEALARTVEDSIPPEDLPGQMEIFREELELEASGTADPDRTRTVQHREYRKDGSTIWVEQRITTLRDADGNMTGLLGLMRDISDRKQAEGKLKSKMDELEEFNLAAVGRELKMIQLKEEVNRLRNEQDKETKYEIVK